MALTNVRAGRATALHAAFQSAKGTAATDFTAATASRLWTESSQVTVAPFWARDQWQTQDLVPDTAGRFDVAEKPEGEISAIATPDSVETILTSNFGAFAAGSFTLASQIASTRWLTLAWIEDVGGDSNQNLIRLRDAWFHTVEFSSSGPRGRVLVNGSYVARSILVQGLAAGGVTLPASPQAPADRNVFSVDSVTVTRDPAGANVSFKPNSLRLILNQGVSQPWDDFSHIYDVIKTGLLDAELQISARVSAEAWAFITNSRAGTKQRIRVTMTAVNPATTLTFDLYEMGFELEPLGHDGRDYVEFDAVALARRTGSNHVAITMA